MKPKALVSVIVPVYNAERTAARCMESILTQSWGHLEVIAVDDGSTDGSLSLLHALAEADPRLHVLHQANRGVSAARNAALQKAQGAYVQFVDSDDTLPPGATASLVQAMERADADLVIAPFTEVFENQRHQRGFMFPQPVLSQAEFLSRFALHPNSFYFSVLWNKLYRRELIAAHAIAFDAELVWGEDFQFNTRYDRWIRRAAVLDCPVYNYARNPHGLTIGMLWCVARHPLYWMGVKWSLFQSYCGLFRSAGLDGKYRMLLPKYLFGYTLRN